VSDGWRPEPRIVHGENYNYELISFQHKCNACQRLKTSSTGKENGKAKGRGKGKGKGRGEPGGSTPEDGEDDEDDKADPDGESGYV